MSLYAGSKETWQPLPLEASEARINEAGAPEPPSEAVERQLKEAITLVEAAFTKVTAVPCQELLESYTQLKAMLGQSPSPLQSMSQEQKAVSEVWP